MARNTRLTGIRLAGLALLLAGCGGGPAATLEPPDPVPPAMIESTITTASSAQPAEEPASSPPPTESGVDGGNADVLQVRAVQSMDGSWTFHVTVDHPDTGWEDYADGWDVVTPDGLTLKPDPDSQFTRTLLHPHENEQPFTRSQAGIKIPAGVNEVRVRAHDLVDGFGGQEVVVDLNTESGPNFEVVRK